MKNKIYSKVFLWLFVGLLVTFITGIYTKTNQSALEFIFVNNGYIFLIILELACAIFLSARIHKMSPITAKTCYLIYSFLSGLSFSAVFIVYKVESIMLVFLIASILFLLFALLGYFTKLDLTKIGSFLLMMLLGVVICSIVNIFMHNETFDLVVTCISILVFLGYIAYDIQSIKRLEGSIEEDNLAVYGAFQLYLDFINIIYDLLRLFGQSDD